MSSSIPTSFTAHPLPGAGRGKGLGYPTINLNVDDIPSEIPHGIYAGSMLMNQQHIPAAIHYGPRPSYDDSISFEVHLIDYTPENVAEALEVTLHQRLRDITNFDSEEALKEQIAMDIEEVQKILANE